MSAGLLLLLKLSIVAMVLAIGLGATVADLGYLWRRPRLLLRSLAAMYVLVPAAAFALVKFLPVGPGVKAAMLVLAVSAGAPLLPKKLGGFGSPYVFSLVVTSSLLAIVLVPTWIALLGAQFGIDTELTYASAAWVIAKAFLIPLALGMAIRARWPGRAEQMSDRLLRFAGIALLACLVGLLVTRWEVFMQLPLQGVGAMVLLMTIALAIGHLLGGPNPDDRTALAIACATRHIGIAALVAAAFPGSRTAVLIAGYLLCSALVSIPYLRWRRRASSG